ncbi:glycosyltransferase family 8 protein [Aspergillus undulatus]|uniref:glycosyltransferase family 8 protein n=1 Tax=Aspergillus undulatus TaxID=1810928 RepID=UPI003CCE4064
MTSNDDVRSEARKDNGKKVWTTLITNTNYLPGLLTLEYSLRRVGSKYPLLVLYTDSFPANGHAALDTRGIAKKHVPYLLPSVPKDFANDARFYDCWSKLTPFSLVEYDRVVQLDSDMVVLQNMDELMDIELDEPESAGAGSRVFAACHACVCNPLRKPHYPEDWTPTNCAYTTQHASPDTAKATGPSASTGLGIPNGGLQVVNPSQGIYNKIVTQLSSSATSNYDFADQSLLGDLFSGRWVALPYIYNALKTLRWNGVHDVIWRAEDVKNVHYILSPKPWNEDKDYCGKDLSHGWWWALNEERVKKEKMRGLIDGF